MGWPLAGLFRSVRDEPPGAVRLRGSGLYLRPPQFKDWPDWAALREDSRAFLVPWEPTWAHDTLSKDAFLRRVRRQATDWRQDTAYHFLAFRAEDDRLVGGLALSQVRRGVAQSASLGYWVGEVYARQGFMSRAVGLALDFAFDRLALHRVEAACLPSNAASKGLLEKSGFTYEGYARAYLRINGQWHDHLLYAMLAEDFRRHRQGLARVG